MSQTKMVRAKYFEYGMSVPYLLASGDDWVKTSTAATVVDEVLRCATTIEESGIEGYEIKVDGRMCFPSEVLMDGPDPDYPDDPDTKPKPRAHKA